MRPLRIAIWTASIVILASGAPQKSTAAKKSAADFSISIAPKQDVIKVGSEVTIEVTLKNTSQRDVLFFSPLDLDTDVEVRDDKASQLKPTKYYDVLRGRDSDFKQLPNGRFTFSTTGGSSKTFTLTPNETLRYEVLASKLFEFKLPGKYTVQARREVPTTKAIVKSNVITLTVTE